VNPPSPRENAEVYLADQRRTAAVKNVIRSHRAETTPLEILTEALAILETEGVFSDDKQVVRMLLAVADSSVSGIRMVVDSLESGRQLEKCDGSLLCLGEKRVIPLAQADGHQMGEAVMYVRSFQPKGGWPYGI